MEVPRPPLRPEPRRRARTVALVAFLGALAGACALVVRTGDAPPVATAAAPTATRAPTTTVSPTRTEPVPHGCSSLPGPEARYRCPIPAGRVDVRHPRELAGAYRQVAGADDGVDARGAAACARGQSEERGWSHPDAVTRESGRYLCRFEEDRAALWWTDTSTGVLAHATRDDGDVAALFAWWLSDASADMMSADDR